ncbi:ImmA/IrrE family metallo-endopeptidase [Mycolicibacterium sp. CBM1]
MLDTLSATRAQAGAGVGAHGRLHASATGWTVYRRTDLPWRRVRFTEAHELGHILLYQQLAFNRKWLDDLHSDEAYLQVERLCDFAAAELLIPSDELTQDLTRHRLETLGDYLWFYDRYMTSHRALLRRVAEVTPATALTVWSWQNHRNGANWRIQESYCHNADGVYIPRGISRRRLDPDVVGMAVESGAATAQGCVDVRQRRYTGLMTALHPSHRDQAELPIYHGRAVHDEPGSSVYVLHRAITPRTVLALRRPGRAS